MSKTIPLLLIPGAIIVAISLGAVDGWGAFGFILVSIAVIVEVRARKAMGKRLEEVESLLANERRERLAQFAKLRAEQKPPATAEPRPVRTEAEPMVASPHSPTPVADAAQSAATLAAEPVNAADGSPLQPPIASPAAAFVAEEGAPAVPTEAALAFESAASPQISHFDRLAPVPAEETAVAAQMVEGPAAMAASVAVEHTESRSPSSADNISGFAVRDVAVAEPGAFLEAVPPTARVADAALVAAAGAESQIEMTPPLPSVPPRVPRLAPAASAVPRPRHDELPEPPAPPRRSLLDIEQILGVNWLSKIGVAILVIGVAFFLAWQLRQLGPFGKDVVGALVGLALLGTGIWGESSERYRILARATLAGGWALVFFISYAAHYVKAAHIVDSPVAALLLMLTVCGAMVAHTMRYRSQVVTGLAFSLAFVTVALSRAGVTSLSANVILAIGFSFVVLRMRWFPLEIIGILATYLNHFLWLRPIVEPMHGHVHPFPELYASTSILILYWAVFRISFVVRRPPDDRTSAVAGMLNAALLLAVGKYQAAHPELAFWALLALGVAEIVCALLVRSRGRRTSFVVLSVVGAALISAAVPFRFAPGNVTLIWLLDAIVFIAAGLLTSERVYRRLGTALVAATTVQLASFPVARLLGARLSGQPAISEWALGLTCLAVTIALYAESLWLPRKWTTLFDQPMDIRAARVEGYLGAGLALAAGWVLFPAYGAVVFWAAFAVLVAMLQRRLRPLKADLTIQAFVLAIAAVARVILFNLPALPAAPSAALHLPSRLISVIVVCALLYWLSYWNALTDGAEQQVCRAATRWAATLLLILLAWYEMPAIAVVIGWTVLALALSAVGRRFRDSDFLIQANAVAATAIVRIVIVNLPASDVAIHQPMRLTWRVIAVVALSAVLYLLSRWNRAGSLTTGAAYFSIPVWAASALLALLLWYEIVPVAVVIAWTALAFVMTAVGRRFKAPHLGLQANVLAAVALGRVVVVNLESSEWLIRAPLHLTWRLLTVAMLAVLLYLLSRWNADGRLTKPIAFTVTPLWAGSTLLVVLGWYELPATAVVLGWIAFGFIVAGLGQWRRNAHLTAQANVVAVASIAHVVAIDLGSSQLALGDPLHVTWRLLAVIFLVALLYALSRWNALAAFELPAGHAVVPRAVATALLMVLAWVEVVPLAVLIVWMLIGFALLIAGRRLRIADLGMQANAVAAAGIVLAIVTNLPANALAFQHPPVSWRLLSVAAVAALLYALSRWRATDLLFMERPESALADVDSENPWTAEWLFGISPMWAATSLLLLLAWYELLPAAVAIAWTLLAIVLMEIGSRRGSRQLILQAHVTIFAVFVRVFVVNMNIDDGAAWGARAYTIVPIIVAILYAYRGAETSGDAAWSPPWPPGLFAWLALICLTALLRFEVASDNVVIAWAALTTGVVALGAFSRRRVFLHIGIAIALLTLARGGVHNLYERSYFPSPHELDRWLLVGAAVALLAGSLPFAFRARRIEALPKSGPITRLLRWIDWRPEQILFFIPLALVTALITTEMRSGMLTVGWGLEAVTVFVVALLVRERSYRLTAVALLLVCVGKIFIVDFWSLNLRDKALTGIVMGLSLIGVSLLYTNKREAIRRWL
jgi:hypothetical protein